MIGPFTNPNSPQALNRIEQDCTRVPITPFTQKDLGQALSPGCDPFFLDFWAIPPLPLAGSTWSTPLGIALGSVGAVVCQCGANGISTFSLRHCTPRSPPPLLPAFRVRLHLLPFVFALIGAEDRARMGPASI